MKREITTRGGRGRTNIDNMSCVLEFTLAQYLRKHEKATVVSFVEVGIKLFWNILTF
jgi:hypothetical protein